MAVSLKDKMTPVGSSGDHGSLAGLSDDDHPQYNIEVLEGGVTKSSSAASLNFTGDGVTVTNTGDAVEVEVSGGGGALGTIDGGTPSTPASSYTFRWDFGGVT